MRRGDLVTVAVQGDDGKPRPALVIQSDHFRALGSVTVLPITSELADAPLLRLALEPDPGNGPQKVSQVMIDKAVTVHLDKMDRRGLRPHRRRGPGRGRAATGCLPGDRSLIQ